MSCLELQTLASSLIPLSIQECGQTWDDLQNPPRISLALQPANYLLSLHWGSFVVYRHFGWVMRDAEVGE